MLKDLGLGDSKVDCFKSATAWWTPSHLWHWNLVLIQRLKAAQQTQDDPMLFSSVQC